MKQFINYLKGNELTRDHFYIFVFLSRCSKCYKNRFIKEYYNIINLEKWPVKIFEERYLGKFGCTLMGFKEILNRNKKNGNDIYCCFIDSDGHIEPDTVIELLRHIKKYGFNVVIGSRHLKDSRITNVDFKHIKGAINSNERKKYIIWKKNLILSQIINCVYKALYKNLENFVDIECGAKIFDKKSLETYMEHGQKYLLNVNFPEILWNPYFDGELLDILALKDNIKIGEIPIKFKAVIQQRENEIPPLLKTDKYPLMVFNVISDAIKFQIFSKIINKEEINKRYYYETFSNIVNNSEINELIDQFFNPINFTEVKGFK